MSPSIDVGCISPMFDAPAHPDIMSVRLSILLHPCLLAALILCQTEVQAQGAETDTPPAGPPPAAVRVTKVGEDKLQRTFPVTGSLRARSRALIASREAAAVDEVRVDEGDRVRKGDLMIRLDRRRLEAQLRELEAQTQASESLITQRKAELQRAELDLKMKQGLHEKNAISSREFYDSRREFEVAESQLRTAQDMLAQSRSRLTLIQVRLEDASILAPFDGVVTAVSAQPGEWKNPGDPVLTLISTGEIEAWLQVAERHAAAVLANDAAVEVRIPGLDTTIPGSPAKVIGDVDARTRMFAAVVVLPNPKGVLSPGMSVIADLPLGANSVHLTVPLDAVITSQGASHVYKAALAPGGEGLPVAEMVPVTRLFPKDQEWVIRAENLKPGDQVVVEGNERLQPGQPLMITGS